MNPNGAATVVEARLAQDRTYQAAYRATAMGRLVAAAKDARFKLRHRARTDATRAHWAARLAGLEAEIARLRGSARPKPRPRPVPPTAAELAAACVAVREGWSDAERLRRMGGNAPAPARLPVMRDLRDDRAASLDGGED